MTPTLFRKILIANRGKSRCIIRTCKEMGIETVAIYSTPDRDALHAQLADEAVCVGPAKAQDSYLNIKNILSAAILTGCEAIHPGFGFLSENPSFADLVKRCGLVFIGPDGDVIRAMGNKSEARRLMRECGVPVVPGSEGGVESVEQGLTAAEEIGYPVLIKASAGGGGRGMRKAFSPEEFKSAFPTAKAEAKACFGDDEVYVEKLLLQPKHIEFQILADNHGNVIHLGERDCSIQRRNQKMIEESPCRALSAALRESMGAHAVEAARAAGYRNAGTVECVLDTDGKYYFIEMNTRIQVEHPVTEMVTGPISSGNRYASPPACRSPCGRTRWRYADFQSSAVSTPKSPRGLSPLPGTGTHGLHIPGGLGVRWTPRSIPAAPYRRTMTA